MKEPPALELVARMQQQRSSEGGAQPPVSEAVACQ
jgi:hypothetical protein